ncbi:hypothetical protein ACFU6I_44565 [Streptomyces sp. NPDC057486]|uniref:hypothetical protein n=1 Tax=Streptomyces sp. NPDC057486 TaxID=3346145 RepID=UPI00367C6EBC
MSANSEVGRPEVHCESGCDCQQVQPGRVVGGAKRCADRSRPGRIVVARQPIDTSFT